MNKFNISKKKFFNLIFICIIFCFPFFLTLQRPLNSTDTSEYYEYYQKSILGIQTVEPTYYYLSRISNDIACGEFGFRILLFFYQLISFSILLIILRKSEKPCFTFFIFFCFAYIYQFSIQIRSCVGNLIFILAVYDIFEKKWKSYYLKMAIAYLFHRSSILFFIVYPFCVFVQKHRKFLYIFPIAFFCLAKSFTPFMESFVEYLGGSKISIMKKLWTYTQLTAYQESAVNPYNKISLFLLVIYYLPLIKFRVKNLSEKEIICLTVISLSFFCYFFGAFNMPIIAQRYPEALNLILLIYLPLFSNRIKEKEIFYLLLALYLVLIAQNYGTGTVMLKFMGLK